MGILGHTELTECVDEERDPVTEVHSDRGPDVMSPDHPLGLLCHRLEAEGRCPWQMLQRGQPR